MKNTSPFNFSFHTQNHFNEQVVIGIGFLKNQYKEQVVIELVFFYTLFIHMKKASYQHNAGGY